MSTCSHAAHTTTYIVSGSYKANPYKFLNFGVSSMALEVNAKLYPKYPPTLKWSTDMAFAQSYMSLFQNQCGSLQDADIPIGYEDFKTGYSIFTFNLTPDGDTCMSHKSKPDFGAIKLLAEFPKPTDDTLLFLVIMEMERCIVVDRDYNVEVV